MRTPTLILGATLTLSAAANLGATVGDPAWMIAGIAATATVPMAMHLWPHIRTTAGPSWHAVVRWCATAVIVATGAAVTVVHTVALLSPAAPVWLALAIVASVELLGVMAAMARAGGTVAQPDGTVARDVAQPDTITVPVAHPADLPAAVADPVTYAVARDRGTVAHNADRDGTVTVPVAQLDGTAEPGDADLLALRVALARHRADNDGAAMSQRAAALATGLSRRKVAQLWIEVA